MQNDTIQQLVFVYNADSGLVNGLLDAAHKALSPGTYSCRLCQLTYGVVTEKLVWKRFRRKLGLPVEFLHRDEFRKKYFSKFMPAYSFPVILSLTAHEMDIFIGTKELNTIGDTHELIREVEKRLRG
jgi:hypothetical protein